MRVDALFAQDLLKPEVLERMKTETGITEPMRQQAMQLVQGGQENAGALNLRSMRIVLNPGRTADEYRDALKHAEVACRIDDNAYFLTTLGVAQYRVGQYAQALQMLIRSDQLNANRFGGSTPNDIAFLAMTHDRLGHVDEAKKLLERLRQFARLKPLEEHPDLSA